MTIDFDDFEVQKSGVAVAEMDNGLRVIIRTLDEEAGFGYAYRVSLVKGGALLQRVEDWFDGFGCEDRPQDVIHTVRALVSQYA